MNFSSQILLFYCCLLTSVLCLNVVRKQNSVNLDHNAVDSVATDLELKDKIAVEEKVESLKNSTFNDTILREHILDSIAEVNSVGSGSLRNSTMNDALTSPPMLVSNIVLPSPHTPSHSKQLNQKRSIVHLKTTPLRSDATKLIQLDKTTTGTNLVIKLATVADCKLDTSGSLKNSTVDAIVSKLPLTENVKATHAPSEPDDTQKELNQLKQNTTTNNVVDNAVTKPPMADNVKLTHTLPVSEDTRYLSKQSKEKTTINEGIKNGGIASDRIQEVDVTAAENNGTFGGGSFCFPSTWSVVVNRQIFDVVNLTGLIDNTLLKEEMLYRQYTNLEIKRTKRYTQFGDNYLPTCMMFDGDRTTYVLSDRHCLINTADKSTLASNWLNLRCLDEYYEYDNQVKQTAKQTRMVLREGNKECYTVLTTEMVTNKQVQKTKFCIDQSSIIVGLNNGQANPLKQVVRFTEEIGGKVFKRKAVLWFTDFRILDADLYKDIFDVPAGCMPDWPDSTNDTSLHKDDEQNIKEMNTTWRDKNSNQN